MMMKEMNEIKMKRMKIFAHLKPKKESMKRKLFLSQKKKETTMYDRLLALEEKKMAKLSAMSSTNDNNHYNNDSDYMFLMSLLPQMKSLPPLRNMYMRLKIQQLFITEQEMLLNNSTAQNLVATSLTSPSSYQSSTNTVSDNNTNQMFPTTVLRTFKHIFILSNKCYTII
ncbi:unnamed protein product [Acanthoscelides obtectus]|uniref:BESS domain-containing protein n=1 Tax=Acanthoscelides obtectus TaxID=200917 RepID=A0A9P0KC07_ACAOB|nr:unnamed protein product [Acanthoscelides obtectus]CAK1623035.1 hypothetical protein AOBTE_LOCUS1780 [Acanthoscelides obtectus]